MDLKAAIDELGKVTKQYGDIVKEFDGKEISADKLAELKRLHDRGMELKAAIEAAQKTADERKDMNDLRSYLERPQPTAPFPVGASGAEDGRKALAARGWEIKGNVLYAPTTKGAVAMWPEEVLFGDIPTQDDDVARFFRTTRAAMQPGYKAAYGKFLVTAVKFRSEAMAFAQLSGAEQKALSEGQDTAGGFLVPPDIQAELLVRKAARSVVRQYATVQPTSRDKVSFPRVQAHGSSGSIYSSGFVGDWAGETPAFSDTDAAFGTFDVAVKKIRVATKLSNDFIADAVSDILAFLAKNGAENMGLVEDKGFIAGDGAALQPKGILLSGATTKDVEGSTANTISNTTTNAGTAPKVIDLVYALPEQYAEKAIWLMTRASEGKTRKLVDAQNRFHWPLTDMAGGLGAGRTLAGYPARNSEFMEEDGTDAKKVYVFGDLSAYVIADRAQISTVILRERFADTDQTGIILFARVGGDTWNPDALRIGIV